MALTVFNFAENQWYVQYADGTLEPVANAASAKTLAEHANNAHCHLQLQQVQVSA